MLADLGCASGVELLHLDAPTGTPILLGTGVRANTPGRSIFFALPNSITEKFCEEKELARNLLSIHAALEKHHFWGPADVPM